MTQPKVSENIDAWCNPCGLLLAHVIMSLKDDRPHRVKCKTCQAVHAFRLAAPKSRKTATKKPARKTAARSPRQNAEYAGLVGERDPASAIPYSMKSSFALDDLINHSKFGLGIVTRLTGPAKIEVLFADGRKELVCNR